MTNGVGVGRYLESCATKGYTNRAGGLGIGKPRCSVPRRQPTPIDLLRGLGTIQPTSSLHNHNKTYIKLHVDDCDASHTRSIAPLGVQTRHQPQAANSRAQAGRVQTIPQPCSLVLHAAGYIGHILRNLSPV
jgi:hypothetical protein